VPLANGSVRLPGASSASAIQLRPLTAAPEPVGSTLPPMARVLQVDERRLTGDRHRFLDGRRAICMFSDAVCPTSRLTPRACGREPLEFRGDLIGADTNRHAVNPTLVGDADELVTCRFVAML
jgi:hypothetical protein